MKIEPRFNRLVMDQWPRKDGCVHLEASTERYLNVKPGVEYSVLMIMQESVLEVYVNDEVAMSARMFNIPDGEFGVYSMNTSVQFKDIKVKE